MSISGARSVAVCVLFPLFCVPFCPCVCALPLPCGPAGCRQPRWAPPGAAGPASLPAGGSQGSLGSARCGAQPELIVCWGHRTSPGSVRCALFFKPAPSRAPGRVGEGVAILPPPWWKSVVTGSWMAIF